MAGEGRPPQDRGIEIETREFNGRPIRKITKAKPAEAASGNAKSIPISTTPADAELAFVSSTLNAFIAAGKINLDARELGNATHLLRRLWRHTFGDRGVPARRHNPATALRRIRSTACPTRNESPSSNSATPQRCSSMNFHRWTNWGRSRISYLRSSRDRLKAPIQTEGSRPG
jgi:hypothetical protein